MNREKQQRGRCRLHLNHVRSVLLAAKTKTCSNVHLANVTVPPFYGTFVTGKPEKRVNELTGTKGKKRKLRSLNIWAGQAAGEAAYKVAAELAYR